ncbi:MAG: hypothetical protein U5K69_27920 [Balneolaceae bacterium]|nr:hypothetical protein [Balneolaceae bacterium]
MLNPADEFVSSFFAFNRLELEMQTFTIQDLLDISKVEKIPKIEDSKKVVSVEPQTTVAQIMHQVDVAKTEINYVTVEADPGSIRHLKVDDLLSYFNKLRRGVGGVADG